MRTFRHAENYLPKDTTPHPERPAPPRAMLWQVDFVHGQLFLQSFWFLNLWNNSVNLFCLRVMISSANLTWYTVCPTLILTGLSIPINYFCMNSPQPLRLSSSHCTSIFSDFVPSVVWKSELRMIALFLNTHYNYICCADVTYFNISLPNMQ